MAEQMKIAALVILAAIVVFAVFTVLGATLYFHAKKRTFPKQTIVLLQWLIRILLCLFVAASFSGSGFSVSGTRLISSLLK